MVTMKNMYGLPTLCLLITTAEAFVGIVIKPSDKEKNNYTCVGESYNPTTDYTYCGVAPKHCEDSKYRSYDGTCNNLKNGWWGASDTPYVRALPCNTYADCVYKMPKGLPNPRTISLRSYVDIYEPDTLWTIAFMQYGQIIAHDLALTAAVPQTKSGRAICCYQGKVTLAGKLDPKCAPITIPEDDPYNAPEGIECIDFYRTETTKDRKCVNATKVAEPINEVTSFLDASYTYGSDEKKAKNLRAWKGGRLKSLIRNGHEVMPQDPIPTLTCDVDYPTEPCYYAGDKRVNQNPQLSLLQNIYLKQHNTIADKLAELNPHWDDETIYQETRKIVIAQHQHVTYYEYLVGLIGIKKSIVSKLIYPGSKTYNNDYDPKINAGVSVEFSSAIFRFFHTQIMGNLWSYKENGNCTETIPIKEWYDKPSVCEYENNFVGLTIGMSRQPASAIDRYMPDDILEFLFKYGALLGQDLKAIDIQRGRDHGLCSYVQAQRLLGLSDPKSFEDLKFIDRKYLKILKDNYKSIEEIDLIVGISLEIRLLDSLSTPTVEVIVIEQMKRTRQGDRCFYENGVGKCALSLDQLNEIRRCSSMANFLCYTYGFNKVQPQAFKVVSPTNPLKDCDEIPKCDLTLWKEKNAKRSLLPDIGLLPHRFPKGPFTVASEILQKKYTKIHHQIMKSKRITQRHEKD